MYCELPKVERCCFCLPLRRGLLIFAYLNILYSGIFLTIYSRRIYSVHSDEEILSKIDFTQYEVLNLYISDVMYGIDIVFSLVLVYGAHRQIVRCLKVYYYYMLITLFAMVILNIYYIYSRPYFFVEFLAVSCTRCFFYIYPIILVRSLIEKLGNTGGYTYDNRLQEIIAGEIKRDLREENLPAEIV